MRMHDIVIHKASFFRTTTEDEEEDAKSWSIQRWLQHGIWKIDLECHPNPYSYLYRGSELNMMNYIIRERKRREKLEKYQSEVYGEFEDEYSGL